MHKWIKFLLIVAACLQLSGCRKKAVQLLHPDVLAKASLQYYWKLPLDLDRRETIARMFRLDENLYCLTSRNRLITIDAAVGKLKWSHSIADAGHRVFRPTHADKVVLPEKVAGIKEILSPETASEPEPFDALLINTLSHVLVFDRNTGKLYRKIPLGFAANTAGESDGVYFYVGSARGWYYAVRLREAVKAWWHSAEDMIHVPVKYFDGSIYVADQAGSLIATRTGEVGKKSWTRTFNGSVAGEFHVDKRGCFVSCEDRRVYALDLLTGENLWAQPFVCRGVPQDDIQVAENTIFQFAERDKLYAINLTTGKERWSKAGGRKVLAAFDGEVYLLNVNNTLLIVDEVLGTVKTSLPMTGWEIFAPDLSTPAIYVASRDAEVACIRKIAAGRLTPEMLAEKP